MATLAELYEFLETKQDDSHLDSRFSYDAFLPVEQPKARLEILTWWKIERLIEDENCNFDKNFIVSYFDERVKATNNQLLKYRYNYFISLLTNDNRYAKQSIYGAQNETYIEGWEKKTSNLLIYKRLCKI